MKISDWNYSFVKLSQCVFAVLAISVVNKGFVDAEVKKSLSNVALYKEAFQSSQFDNASSPDLAVDDNITTCSVTAKQKSASWTVDLGNVYPISHMKINTGGTYFGSNFEILISQINIQDGGRELCSIGNCENEEECMISCFSGPVLARVVHITNKYASGVMLCDVQVFVCEDQFFGLHCKMQCRCNDDEVCDKLSGKCPRLCAPGFNGTDCQSVCSVGYFGPSCSKRCHCVNSGDCNKQTGECPGPCANGWVGPGCQTEIPRLVTAPSMFSTDVTQIKIVWQSWIHYVDPSITLLYQVQFKLSSDSHRDNQSWVKGPLAPDKDAFNEEATVTGLQRNSFYVFRVIPILRLGSAEQISGIASPESPPLRTKCSVPETPNITAAYALLDTSRQRTPLAILCVEWTPLTQKQSNCENILYYEVYYQNAGQENWKNVGAKSTEHAKNISFDISFSTEYEVKVVVHNNHPYQSSSDTKPVLTPPRPPSESTATVPTVVIIVTVVIGAGVLLALFLAFLIYRHKMRTEYVKMKRPFGMKSGSSVECMISHPNNVYDELIHPHHIIFPGDEIPKKKKKVKKRPPIKVEELENYISTKQENDCEELRKEYRDIPEINNEASMSIGERIDNRHKNRFINIIPYDHSRVILKEKDGDSGSDYINASYIDGYKKPHAYIASQGCTKATTQDFWRMIWEQDSRRIVMVTNLVEKGKIKCEPYWPDKMNEEKSFHDIKVMLTDEEKTADFVIRTLEVRRGSEVRNIKQFHYTTWPDHGVPSRAGPIIVFRRKVRSFDDSHPGIIVVHCSAGVGRTGAFIALDSLLDQAKAEGQVDVYGLTRLMRKNRGNMIQTVEQYFFVYNALLEALKSGNTVISCSEFRSVYESLCRVDDVTGKSRLQEQFEMLQSLVQSAKADDCLLAQQPENQDKNRYSTILPADRHRPYLMTKVPGTNDYINAVFLDGHCSRNAFIITQMPLPHTVIDLWRMIYEHKCLTIVMLNQRDEQDETYGQYWPEENEECECGPFVIEIVSISRPTPDVVLRKLKLCYNCNSNGSASLMRDAGPRIINHIQLTNWNSDDLVPPSPHSLVSVIELVEQSQKRAGNSPVVIHCHDGVTQSGLFAAVCCIWERLRDDQEIDVFQTVKHLRYYRRQIVEDLTQYQFCYDMVLEYLEDFSTYSNFK